MAALAGAYRPASTRGAAWVVVAVLHALLIGAWLTQRATVLVPAKLRLLELQLLKVEEPPPPPPPLPPPPEPPRPRWVPQFKPPPPPPPQPVVKAPAPPKPLHDAITDWVQPDEQAAVPSARRAPPDYADQVKAAVVSKVVYPAAAVYPAPRGYKGDPRELMRQCTVPYEVVVNRQGQIISYDFDPCHDELLDAAAEAAILKAQPFAPPPEGAEQYRIYGSVNFIKPNLSKTATR